MKVTDNQIEEKTYVYVFVRGDIPLEQQIVQACHASLEVGLRYPYIAEEPSSLILIKTKNQTKLEKARLYLAENGIRSEIFFEPSWDYGNTAFATEAITESQRHILRRFQLWKP